MDKLKDFFKNNDVRIGKDFKTFPPPYYSSLNEAFYTYFLTFREKKDTFHFVLDIHNWTRESKAFNFTGANYNIVSSILGFHRFMELLLKDILRRINPYLAVKFLEKEEELFQFLDNQANAEDIKTIEYSETMKRFKQAYKHYDNTSEAYINHLKDYEFLITKQSSETLTILSDWRNRIMHNGATLPNLFAFEYLVSQRIIPIINQILKVEKKYFGTHTPLYLETRTGIKILDEILNVKFEFEDFANNNKSKSLAISLLKIGHIKEIGRTVYHQHINQAGNNYYYEPYYDNPIARAERFAEVERLKEDFFNLTECICCGIKSLVVYRQPNDAPWVQDKFISWLRCYNCDYSLKNNVGDPNYFNLTKEPIFATK
jgi:hypothetical protein